MDADDNFEGKKRDRQAELDQVLAIQCLLYAMKGRGKDGTVYVFDENSNR
jgi:hypothetical protein